MTAKLSGIVQGVVVQIIRELFFFPFRGNFTKIEVSVICLYSNSCLATAVCVAASQCIVLKP